MTETFSAINFADLPAPSIVEQLSFDDVYTEVVAFVRAQFPEYGAALDLDSSPTSAVLQAFGYRETTLRARLDAVVEAMLLPSASGSMLDQLAAFIPLTRGINESDTEFRDRIRLAPEGFSTAGARGGYVFHALSANRAVTKSVDVISPARGEVDVYVLPVAAIMPDNLLDQIRAALSDDVRPLTDLVRVKAPTFVPYSIEAEVRIAPGHDPDTVLPAVITALQDHAETRRDFRLDVFRSGLIAAGTVSGVENLVLISPAQDVSINVGECSQNSGVTITQADEL